MKKNSILFMLLVLIGSLLQGCTPDDYKEIEFSIRDLPTTGGLSSTQNLRKAIGASWLGWTYTIEDDGTVVANVNEKLNEILGWRAPVEDNVGKALIALAINDADIVILDKKPDEFSSDPTTAEKEKEDWDNYVKNYSAEKLSQKVIGYTATGHEVVAYIKESTNKSYNSYKLYEYLTTPAGQAVVKQLGYTAL